MFSPDSMKTKYKFECVAIRAKRSDGRMNWQYWTPGTFALSTHLHSATKCKEWGEIVAELEIMGFCFTARCVRINKTYWRTRVVSIIAITFPCWTYHRRRHNVMVGRGNPGRRDKTSDKTRQVSDRRSYSDFNQRSRFSGFRESTSSLHTTWAGGWLPPPG